MSVPAVYNDVTVGNMQQFLSQLQMAEFTSSPLLNVKRWAAIPACSATEAKQHCSVSVLHKRGDSADECPLEAVVAVVRTGE